MNVIVNGKDLTLENNTTVGKLLEKLEVKDKVMAVAINMEIVKKDNWSYHLVKDGDKIELLHFVGGG